MSTELSLTIGLAIVAWLCGLELGAQLMSETAAPLPEGIAAIAQQLGELHVAHRTAQQHEERFVQAKADVNRRLVDYVAKLRQLFTWE